MKKAPKQNVPYGWKAPTCPDVDIHEILKKEIYTQGGEIDTSAGISASYNVGPAGGSSPASGSYGYEDNYLYLDSMFSNSTKADRLGGKIVFEASVINNNKSLGNIVAIQPTAFYFPKPANPPTGTPEFYFARKVYMQIEELSSSQAVKASNSFFYHFEFDVQNATGIAVYLVPTQETTTLYIRSPITALDQLTCKFYAPSLLPNFSGIFAPVPIPRDVVRITSLNNNPARFIVDDGLTPETITDLFGPISPPVAPGFAVWITMDVSLADPVMDALFKSAYGTFVTDLDGGPPYYVEIGAANSSAIPAGLTGYMTVGKNRAAMQMRFTSLTNTSYNKITLSHD